MPIKFIIALSLMGLASLYNATELRRAAISEIASASDDDIRWRDEHLPHALEWIAQTIQTYAGKGRALMPREVEIARKVGVAQPDLVRVHFVDRIPLPEQGKIAEALNSFGFDADRIRGMTMEYTIFINAELTDTLLQHELVHVAQYEHFGRKGFFSEYLLALKVLGPRGVPFEIEAYTKQSQ